MRTQSLLSLLLAASAVFAAPTSIAAPKPPNEKKLNALELEALEAMKHKAAELKVEGVALVNFAPGAKVDSWTSHMAVVGHMKDEPTATSKGNNLLAFASQKSAEMADTLVDSGTAKRPLMNGELGWQGGVVSEIKLTTGPAHIIVSFSGGKSEDDVQISRAGLAVMMKGL